MTLNDWLDSQDCQHELASLLQSIVSAGIQIHDLVRQGDLAGFQGASGIENVQGEQQQKLDLIANDMLMDALKHNVHCRALASEEMDHSVEANPEGKFLVVFDPLDGSSNIDINMPVGTIFSVLPSSESTGDDALLQPGSAQCAAGYLLYGTATMLALSLGGETRLFTLDLTNHTYVTTRESAQRIAPDTKEFAINASNQRFWEAPVQAYFNECLAGTTGVRGKNFNMRWVAAMVGDVHRILCRGGLFAYPRDTKDPSKAGKLRLLYEANPMSLLIEGAGGRSSTGTERILEIQPANLHQRVPVILGSRSEVDYLVAKHLAD